MKVELSGSAFFALTAVAIVAGAGWFLWNRRGAIVAAVNPADPDNLVNRGANAIVQRLTGDASETVGGRLAEWFDPGTRAVADALKVTPAAAPAPAPYGLPDYYAP